MASSQTVVTSQKHLKHRGNGGHGLSGAAQEPQAMGDPPLADAMSQAISEAAYYRAESRGFEPGHEMEDWVEAEREVVAARGADH